MNCLIPIEVVRFRSLKPEDVIIPNIHAAGRMFSIIDHSVKKDKAEGCWKAQVQFTGPDERANCQQLLINNSLFWYNETTICIVARSTEYRDTVRALTLKEMCTYPMPICKRVAHRIEGGDVYDKNELYGESLPIPKMGGSSEIHEVTPLMYKGKVPSKEVFCVKTLNKKRKAALLEVEDENQLYSESYISMRTSTFGSLVGIQRNSPAMNPYGIYALLAKDVGKFLKNCGEEEFRILLTMTRPSEQYVISEWTPEGDTCKLLLVPVNVMGDPTPPGKQINLEPWQSLIVQRSR